MENLEEKKELSFKNITKKFWKEQIILYTLTTMSGIMSSILDENAVLSLTEKLFEKNKEKEIIDEIYTEFRVFNYKIFGSEAYLGSFSNKWLFLLFISFLSFFYCVIVLAHVFYSYLFSNKISSFIRLKLMNKFFRLQKYEKKNTLNIFNDDIENYRNNIIFFPNQIFYLVITSFFGLLLLFLKNREEKKKIDIYRPIWAGFIYIVIMSLSTFFLEKILLKADLKFKNFLEEKNKDENKIINNRDLIIKKNLEDNFFNNYKKTVSSIENENNTKDLFFTFFWVIPSYFFVPFSDFWILAFLQGLGKNALLATKVFARIFSGVKKMIERLRYYPFFLSSFKRIEKFLSQEERNDIQKNILISEKINNLTFDKVFFGYEKNKLVLEKFSMNFEMGKINYLNAENGFGKSTIVSLILGLYLPNSGEITINNKYKINEINLIEWRKKISYAENENLIEENLSSGQKQLIELNSALKRIKEKEIIIFDEADSCLDEEKRNDFRKYLKTQAKDKIIIFISHI